MYIFEKERTAHIGIKYMHGQMAENMKNPFATEIINVLVKLSNVVRIIMEKCSSLQPWVSQKITNGLCQQDMFTLELKRRRDVYFAQT